MICSPYQHFSVQILSTQKLEQKTTTTTTKQNKLKIEANCRSVMVLTPFKHI